MISLSGLATALPGGARTNELIRADYITSFGLPSQLLGLSGFGAVWYVFGKGCSSGMDSTDRGFDSDTVRQRLRRRSPDGVRAQIARRADSRAGLPDDRGDLLPSTGGGSRGGDREHCGFEEALQEPDYQEPAGGRALSQHYKLARVSC